jgi:hypothetical protein
MALGVTALAAASQPDGSVELEVAEGAPPPEWFGPEDFPGASGGSMEQLRDVAAEQQIELAQRGEWLESAQAVDEREQSRTIFSGLSDGEALNLLTAEWADVLRPPLPDAETLVGSDQIEGFVDDATMRVDGLNGHDDRLVVSEVPLRTADDSGVKAPTDVDVIRQGESFVPENSTADVTMPVALEDGARIDTIEVTPDGEAEGVKLDGDTVAYPNADVDTDVALVSTLTGIETFHQLRSDQAPENLRLDVTMPAGATLEHAANGGVNVVGPDGLLVSISPAIAVDAQGEPVPAELVIDGSAVVVQVDHQDRDVAYPILVDPFVEEDWANNGTPNTTGTWFHQNAAAIAGLSQWSHTHSANVGDNVYSPRFQCYMPVSYTCYSASHNGSAYDGLHMLVRPGTAYPANSFGEWYYVPPGYSTRINRVDWGAMHLRPGGTAANPLYFYGILSSVDQSWLALRTFSNATAGGAVNNITHDWYAQFAGTYQGPQYLVAGWTAMAAANVPYWRDGYIGGMIVQLTDPDQPTNLSVQKTGPTDWTNTGSFTASPEARDAGVGMKSFTLRVPSSTGSQVQTRTHPCTGRKASPCPSYDYRTPPAASSKTWALPDASIAGVNGTAFGFSAADANPAVAGNQPIPEGTSTVTLEARDIIHPEAPTTTTWQVKVDRTNPSSSLAGVSSNQLLADQNYSLTASGQDSLSGAATVALKLDGVVKSTNSSCPPAGQTCSTSWTLDGSAPSLADGSHTLEVSTTDRAGNVATHARSFLVDRTGPTINVAGDLDPVATEWLGGWIGGGDHVLRMAATDDGESESPATGAADVALYVDNVLKSQASDPSCDDDSCAVDDTGTADAAALSYGTHTVKVVAHDQVGNESVRTWSIKIDNQAPSAQLTGSLFEGSSQVAAASEDLTIVGNDGPTVFSPQSAVSDIAISIDGNEVSRASRDVNDCGLFACAMQHSYTLNANSLTVGDHEVKVTMTDAASNTATNSWTITVPSQYAGTVCPTAAATPLGDPVPSGDLVTPAAAEDQLDQHAAAVIAPSEPTDAGQVVDPTVETRPESLASSGTVVPAEAASSLNEGIAVGDPQAPVCIAPTEIAPNASAPVVVGGDSALIANSQAGVDTVVRPTAAGMETLLQIRDSAAPTSYSWEVDLQANQELTPIANDLVAVVDVSSPNPPEEGPPITDDPAPPANDSTTDIDDDLGGVEAPEPVIPLVDPPPATAVERREAVPDAENQLTQAEDDLDRAQSAVEGTVVAVISAPWATDARDQAVSTELSVDGGTVTMAVAHQGADYPVVADPVASAPVGIAKTGGPHKVDKDDCEGRSSPCGKFNHSAAIAYVRKYAVKFNSSYPNYSAGDCTNFMSQALKAGGMQMMREYATGQGSWWYKFSQGSTHSWSVAEVLHDHLKEYHLAHTTQNWAVGELVFFNYHDGGRKYDHVAMVTKKSGNNIYIGGHGGHQGSEANYAEKNFHTRLQKTRAKHPGTTVTRLYIDHSAARIN